MTPINICLGVKTNLPISIWGIHIRRHESSAGTVTHERIESSTTELFQSRNVCSLLHDLKILFKPNEKTKET